MRRETAETSLKASKEHFAELLKSSNLAREQKKLLARDVLMAQEEERRQISRTLHDEISQILAGINVKLATLTQEASASSRAFKKKIADAQELVEKSVIIVHRFARDLRPTLLDDLGLVSALHAHMKLLARQTGLHIRFTAAGAPDVEKMSNIKRTALYRVAQSALDNIIRHAKATQVTVKLEKTPSGYYCLEVHDNGKSFQVDRILLSRRYKRIGLISMRERMEMLSGTFSVTSAPGEGTTVQACVPLDRKKA
jgi:signal transduction histidine kinase